MTGSLLNDRPRSLKFLRCHKSITSLRVVSLRAQESTNKQRLVKNASCEFLQSSQLNAVKCSSEAGDLLQALRNNRIAPDEPWIQLTQDGSSLSLSYETSYVSGHKDSFHFICTELIKSRFTLNFICFLLPNR